MLIIQTHNIKPLIPVWRVLVAELMLPIFRAPRAAAVVPAGWVDGFGATILPAMLFSGLNCLVETHWTPPQILDRIVST